MLSDIAMRFGGRRSPKKSPPLGIDLQVAPRGLRRLEKKRIEFANYLSIRAPKIKAIDKAPKTISTFVRPDIQGFMEYIGGRSPLHPRSLRSIVSHSKSRWTVVVANTPWASFTCVADALSLTKGFKTGGLAAKVVPA